MPNRGLNYATVHFQFTEPGKKVFLFLHVQVIEVRSTAFAGCILAFEIVVNLVKWHFRFETMLFRVWGLSSQTGYAYESLCSPAKKKS